MTRPVREKSSQQQQQHQKGGSCRCEEGADNHHHNLQDTPFIFAMSGTASSNNNNARSIYHERLRRFYRRPDRHPFVIDIPGSIFHGSRSMPAACTKYPVVVGQSFWRLAAYLDSVPPYVVRQQARSSPPSPHIILTGMPGCGKSYLMAAASALLGFTHRTVLRGGRAPSKGNNGGSNIPANRATTTRTVFIGDCLGWIQAEDPLQYFRMELMSAFREENAAAAAQDQDPEASQINHRDPEHPGCLVCVEPFSRLEQLQRYLERIVTWITTYHPTSQLVFFLDQAEALGDHPDSLPTRIVAILIHLRLPVLVFGLAQSALKRWTFRTSCGEGILQVPYRFSSGEYNKHLELLSKQENHPPIFLSDLSHVQELRAWTGCVPAELARFFELLPGEGGNTATTNPTNPNTTSSSSFTSRLLTYQKDVEGRVWRILQGWRLDQQPRQRNTLLIGLFAMILRVPLDWTEKFQIGELRELLLDGCGSQVQNHKSSDHSAGSVGELGGFLLADAIQTFYHPSEGSLSLRAIPTAISHAAYLALSHPRILQVVAGRPWVPLFETVVTTMVGSKQLCAESKRRFSRFYAHTRLRWISMDPSSSGGSSFDPIIQLKGGKTELGEEVTVRFDSRHLEVVHYSTLVPSHTLLGECLGGGGGRRGGQQAFVFLPTSPRYWFFDLFILLPDERRLWAVTTAPIVGTWLRDLSTRAGPMQLAQQREDGLATPLILLEAWRDVLKRCWTGSGKVGVRCLILRPTDLMGALRPAGSESTTMEDIIAPNDPVTRQLASLVINE